MGLVKGRPNLSDLHQQYRFNAFSYVINIKGLLNSLMPRSNLEINDKNGSYSEGKSRGIPKLEIVYLSYEIQTSHLMIDVMRANRKISLFIESSNLSS